MAGKWPWFKMFADDWLTSPTTRSMTDAERGQFIDILCMIWRSSECGIKAKALPTLGEALATLFQNGENVLKKHPENPDLLTHQKLYDQYAEKKNLRKVLSEAGKRGGRPPCSKDKKARKKRKRVGLQESESESESRIPPTSPPQGDEKETRKPPRKKSTEQKIKEMANGEYSPGFLAFWAVYPRSDNKRTAFRAYCRRAMVICHRKYPEKRISDVDEHTGAALVAVVEEQMADEDSPLGREEARFIPYAASWLNAEGFMP